MERISRRSRGAEGKGEGDREKGDLKEEVNEIGNEETREWTR